MPKDLVARASIAIAADRAAVWDALTKPEIIRQYMFGTTVETTWHVGDPITWKGEWKGKPYEDKGVILKCERGRLLAYTHFSPLTGQPDVPENYHTVTVELSQRGSDTVVTLSQDNNETEDDRRHSEENWSAMLVGLQRLLTGTSP